MYVDFFSLKLFAFLPIFAANAAHCSCLMYGAFDVSIEIRM